MSGAFGPFAALRPCSLHPEVPGAVGPRRAKRRVQVPLGPSWFEGRSEIGHLTMKDLCTGRTT